MGFVQQDYRAIGIGQVIQAALYAGAGLFPLDHFEGGGRCGYRRSQLAGGAIGFYGRMTFAPAQAIEGDMSGDAVQPTANGFGIAQRVAATVSAEEGLLGQVFGLRGVAQQTEQVAINAIVVRLEELARVHGFGCRRHSASSSHGREKIHDRNHRLL